MKTPKTNKYKKCKECYANYPDDVDYHHQCDAFMLYMIKVKRLMERKNESKH